MSKQIDKYIFSIRFKIFNRTLNRLKIIYYRLLGMRIGENVNLNSIYTTWPHQVSIGNNCNLEHNIFFKYDGIWSEGPSIIIEDSVFIGANCEFNINCNIRIGKYSNVASNCRFIDHDHGTKLGERIGIQPPIKKEINIGEDVWLGTNVTVLKGVSIGKGAVVAAGAVVNKSILPYEIWGGVPARKIRERK